MCGITGFIGQQEPDLIQSMVAAMKHRGPDGDGFYRDGDVNLGMCRLSIIDVEGGQQPFSSEDGSITAMCNGEIYNFEEIKEKLIQKGHRFHSKSDAEIIPHLYEEEGVDFVKSLRGMFGISLWDKKKQRLVLARDRVGIKPLFYSFKGKELTFGSEIKCLLKSPSILKEINWTGLDQFFNLGYIPSPHTIYQSIQKLDPGHILVWEKGQVKKERYWDVQYEPFHNKSEDEIAEEFLSLFKETIRMHLMSDVPLGAFLSGGVDSSLIVALMSEMTNSPVKTFTMGFGGNRGGYLDERNLAKRVSQQYKTDHTEFEVEPNLTGIIDEIVQSFDEPFADDSVIPSYYICKLARQKVKVALTGLGGDELFGGYERYLGLSLSEKYDRIPGFIRRGVIAPIVNGLPELKNGHYTINHMKRFVRSSEYQPARRYQEYVSVFNQDGRHQLMTQSAQSQISEASGNRNGNYFDRPNATTLLDKALYQDTHTYLPEDILALSDRLSMWNSLELRVPFVDHKIIEFCARIPAALKIKGREKKALLRKVARRFLPHDILSHRKQGFASPMAAWLRSDLKEYIQDSLSPTALARTGILNSKTVNKLMNDHLNRKELNDRKLFSILMFQKWSEKNA